MALLAELLHRRGRANNVQEIRVRCSSLLVAASTTVPHARKREPAPRRSVALRLIEKISPAARLFPVTYRGRRLECAQLALHLTRDISHEA